MADIFLSYASANRSNAEALANVLEKLGWKVWLDERIPLGLSYPQVIYKNLKTAKCVIVLWTKASAASEWVQIEASEGAKRKILIPILLENIEIPLEFRRYQTAKLIGWRSANQYHPEFQKLYARLTELLDDPRYSPEGPPFSCVNPEPSPIMRKFFIAGVAVLSIIAIWVLASIIDFPPHTSNSVSSEPPQPEMIAKDKIEENYKKGIQLHDAGNYKEALQWLDIAADQGHSEALKKAISMLVERKVVDKNDKKLNELISKAKALEEKKQE